MVQELTWKKVLGARQPHKEPLLENKHCRQVVQKQAVAQVRAKHITELGVGWAPTSSGATFWAEAVLTKEAE